MNESLLGGKRRKAMMRPSEGKKQTKQNKTNKLHKLENPTDIPQFYGLLDLSEG
jgi:hypothetical protein